jgi:hypothetical protein
MQWSLLLPFLSATPSEDLSTDLLSSSFDPLRNRASKILKR